MGGQPREGAAYWRRYRAEHPAYRERDNAARRHRHRGDRSAEYAKLRARRAAERAARQPEPLAPLYPELNHGATMAYWHDELRMDLAQERALAEHEGRDPAEAVRAYRAREMAWWALTVPLLDLR